MAIPRVFISSTCYDLKHIRENLKYFVRTIGYEPVLSDDGDVFYNPSSHTHDSCLKEVETCQLFILIIGGRYGGLFNGSEKSITNTEYQTAVSRNIPVFALVENGVYSDHFVYTKNLKLPENIASKINYPSSDSTKIFEFIDEVRKNVTNNAIFSFRDFSDMETYLKKQWAGLMYDFLSNRLDEDRSKATINLLENLNIATKKTEELLKLVARQNQSTDTNVEDAIKNIDRITIVTQKISELLNNWNLKEYFKEFTPDEFTNLISRSNSYVEFISNLPGAMQIITESYQDRSNKPDIFIESKDKKDIYYATFPNLSDKKLNELNNTLSTLKKMTHDDIKFAYEKMYQ
ncbi:hypothetical protein CF116_02410 [Aeromonas veronii]|uniref:DUF4062 domain-containing protein n=1 Tax=Aeromonas veronii TaxID=654 RepID=UPI001119B437|nr:DUF4062 domain-containing protein [Aeromonas veronii]TNI83615.1 hypothetical protein CF116_02410 [Aeromonas veronii]